MILFISHFKKIHGFTVCRIFWWKARVKAERPVGKFLQKCHFTQELMTYQSHALPIFVSPTTYQPGSVTAEVYWLKHAYQEKWASSEFYGIILNELSRLCVIKFSKLYTILPHTRELVFSPIHQGIDSIFWQQWFILILFSTDFYSILLKQDYYVFFYPNEPKMIIYSTNSRQTILKLTDQ